MLAKYRALDDKDELDRALDIIENRHIYLSPIKDFNDPLEARMVKIPIDGYAGYSMSQNIDKLPGPISASIERFRATCFSSDCRNIQMWAHYSHCFTGMCICLSGSISSAANMVTYTDKVIRNLYCDFPISCSELDERVKAALLVKQRGWEYEKEYRIIRQADPSNGPMYISYDPRDLKAVILGQNVEKPVRDRIRLACERVGVPLYVTYIGDLSCTVGVCPEGFSLEKNGASIEAQIKNYCNEHDIKPFEDLEAECPMSNSSFKD